MPEHADLCRRLGAAARSPNLHPNYARELLRAARQALEDDARPEKVVLRAWCAANVGIVP
jgi:hypothetical protein